MSPSQNGCDVNIKQHLSIDTETNRVAVTQAEDRAENRCSANIKGKVN